MVDFDNNLQSGDAQIFNLPDGLTITATFSDVTGGVYGTTDFETWSGAYLHGLYNTVETKEAFTGNGPPSGSTYTATVSFVATKNGFTFRWDLLALGAESANGFNGTWSASSNRSVWSALETIGTSGNWLGENTNVVTANGSVTTNNSLCKPSKRSLYKPSHWALPLRNL